MSSSTLLLTVPVLHGAGNTIISVPQLYLVELRPVMQRPDETGTHRRYCTTT